MPGWTRMLMGEFRKMKLERSVFILHAFIILFFILKYKLNIELIYL